LGSLKYLLHLLKIQGDPFCISKLYIFRESRPAHLVANLLKTLGMAGYFLFNNVAWAIKFKIISGTKTSCVFSRDSTGASIAALRALFLYRRPLQVMKRSGADCRSGLGQWACYSLSFWMLSSIAKISDVSRDLCPPPAARSGLSSFPQVLLHSFSLMVTDGSNSIEEGTERTPICNHKGGCKPADLHITGRDQPVGKQWHCWNCWCGGGCTSFLPNLEKVLALPPVVWIIICKN